MSFELGTWRAATITLGRVESDVYDNGRGAMPVADRDLYTDASKAHLVGEADAAFLVARKGQSVPHEYADQYAQLVARESSVAASVKASEPKVNKARKPGANKAAKS